MKVGEFAIFRGLPVAIKSIKKDQAEIDYCLQLLNDEERKMLDGFQRKVPLDKLKPFTHESAKALRARYQKQIGQCNIVVQGIDDCLKYL